MTCCVRCIAASHPCPAARRAARTFVPKQVSHEVERFELLLWPPPRLLNSHTAQASHSRRTYTLWHSNNVTTQVKSLHTRRLRTSVTNDFTHGWSLHRLINDRPLIYEPRGNLTIHDSSQFTSQYAPFEEETLNLDHTTHCAVGDLTSVYK